jgi:hypothetical protein
MYIIDHTPTCTNARHDHTTTIDHDGVSLDAPIPMLCMDCDAPTHYDETVEDYVHDEGPGCFLALPADEGSPCNAPTCCAHHPNQHDHTGCTDDGCSCPYYSGNVLAGSIYLTDYVVVDGVVEATR